MTTISATPETTTAISSTPNAKPVTANDLRWAGEAADGMRDQDLVLTRHEDGKLKVVPVKEADSEVLFKVRTDSDGLALTADRSKFKLTYEGKDVPIPPDTDAVFLTQSAVEKFVLPYYTRMKHPGAIDYLRNKLFGKNENQQGKQVLLAIHIPPSYTMPVSFDLAQRCRTVVLEQDGKISVEEQ